MNIRPSFLSVFFPSLLLLAAAGAPGLDGWNQHREVFGSENYYLTVLYSGSPNGVLAPASKPIRFAGSIVTSTGEFRVQGVRRPEEGGFVYEFSSAEGSYVGRLKTGQCPQYLDLAPSLSGQNSEKLRAGTCL